MSRIDDLAYQCRKCKKKCVGFGNVVLQEIVFRTAHEGKQMIATLIWCPDHAPKEDAA